MKKFAAITSMDYKYYRECGKFMLISYDKYWKSIMPLYLYNEDNFIPSVDSIICQGWDLGNDYQNFQQRHTNNRVKTFSKKAFSIIHAMNNIECDRLIWIDADVVINSKIHVQLLDLISDDSVLSTHFSVWHDWPDEQYPDRVAHSCETGFFILNKNHRLFTAFKNTYTDIYVNDKTQDMRRFYDGEVYGKTVDILEKQGAKMLNLNPGLHKTPISRSILSPYMEHFKAGLKNKIFNIEKDKKKKQKEKAKA